jgi:hypothetical protein
LLEVITELSNGQDTGLRWSAIGVEFTHRTQLRRINASRLRILASFRPPLIVGRV